MTEMRISNKEGSIFSTNPNQFPISYRPFLNVDNLDDLLNSRQGAVLHLLTS